MLQGMDELDGIEERRRQAVAMYLTSFTATPCVTSGALFIPSAITADMPLVRFPILVADTSTAEGLIHHLRAQGSYAGRWYRPALFPGVVSPEAFGLAEARLPVSDDLVARVVNLPTIVRPAEAENIAQATAAFLNG
jgi:dTDP-4-amino-4,6-dideoxygalactose transaminase